MANKTLFKTSTRKASPVANAINAAGGQAYNLSDTNALCQYVVTGTFNQTYYLGAEEQLKQIESKLQNVSSEFIAKAAIYGHEEGKMKDVPAYLVAVLAARQENDLLAKVFPRVITNMKMLCNFVQIIRSGKTGRKSFGTAVKRIIQNWLTDQDPDKLFNSSIGHANPSLVDIIKMVHPKPRLKAQEALFGYLLDKPFNKRNLPKLVKQFEAFKADNTAELPDVPFRALTNANLTTEHWRTICENMNWTTLRMNLNMLNRNKVFDDKKFLDKTYAKLTNENSILKSKVLPYQLLTAYQNTTDIPQVLKMGLQEALETSVLNVPAIDGDIAVCIDVSGSMGSPVTGNRGSVTTVTRCVDVAALMAACLLRQNPSSTIVQFDTYARELSLNPKDSIVTNTKQIAADGGGTNCATAIEYLLAKRWKGDLVVFISDNQSWMGSQWGYATGMQTAWNKLKATNRNAKLVCIDITPNTTAQVVDDKNTINIGGFSDTIFDIIARFAKDRMNGDFTKIVDGVKL